MCRALTAPLTDCAWLFAEDCFNIGETRESKGERGVVSKNSVLKKCPWGHGGLRVIWSSFSGMPQRAENNVAEKVFGENTFKMILSIITWKGPEI